MKKCIFLCLQLVWRAGNFNEKTGTKTTRKDNVIGESPEGLK
jgi:hypothetical protein